METGVIYKITSPFGRIYIGQTKNIISRRNAYKKLQCKKQQKIYHSLLKYGWDNHTFKIIEEIKHDIFYYEISNACEIYWIKYYDSVKNGLNIQEGGKNSPLSQDTKDKISAAHKGKPKSEAHIKIMSDRMIGNQHGKGRIVSDEERKRVSKLHKGKIVSEETRKKQSIIKLGRKNGPQTEEWKNNISKANSVKIKCLTNNKIFNSLSEAAKELNLTTTKISRVCKGKSKHTKGYKFEYIN